MQWLFFIIGALIGAVIGETFASALTFGALGIVIAQHQELRRRLSDIGREFQHITHRLAALEKAAPPKAEPEQTKSEVAETAPDIAAEKLQLESDVWLEPAKVESTAVEPAAVESTTHIPQSTHISSLDADVSRIETASAVSKEFSEQNTAAKNREAAARVIASAPEPKEPSLIVRAFIFARDWLLGGNTVLRVGVVLLFLGLAFLLRYASERVVLPVEFRYLGVALTAIVLLAVGWRLRHRNNAYGLMLQGAGIAVLYLTVFAALRLQPLLTSTQAFSLLIAITVCSAILAITQNALALAAAAALGGFAAPILASAGSGNHVALFSYFALLNGGIFAIAWFKAWRTLNVIGFVGTFGIGFAWGVRSYQPELFATTEPFLILFFLLYVAIGWLFSQHKLRADAANITADRDALLQWTTRRTDYVDGTIMFGPPIIGFGLQYALIKHIELGAAFSALALGLFYMVLARILVKTMRERIPLLIETYIALGLIFATLAIPLGLNARWTAAAWAVEAAGIYWLGMRQQRRLARYFALFVQACAAISFISTLTAGQETLLSGAALGALLLGAALLFSFHVLRSSIVSTDVLQKHAWEKTCIPVFACTGLAFLYLLAPLNFDASGTAIAWALAGVATIFAGLRLQSNSFLFSAFAVQLLGGAIFLMHTRSGDGTGGAFDAGWRGLFTASLVGFSLIAGMIFAARDSRVRGDGRLLRALAVVLLAGLLFINLAVLFVLPWRNASGVWACTGLLIIWLSLQLRQRLSFFFGLALQLIGGMAFLATNYSVATSEEVAALKPLLHPGFWAPIALALAAFIGAWRLHREAQREDSRVLNQKSLTQLVRILLIWSIGWWALGWIGEIQRFVADALQPQALQLITAISAIFAVVIALRARWRDLALASALQLPMAIIVVMAAWHPYYHPAAEWGWLTWLAFAVAHFFALRKLESLLPQAFASNVHRLGVWIIVGVLALEIRYAFIALAEQYNAWRWLGWACVPSIYLLVMASPLQLNVWPLLKHQRDYRVIAAAPIAVVLLLWVWIACAFSNGSAEPLPYLPIINPLELGVLLVLFALYRWSQTQLPQMLLAAWRDKLIQQIAGASLLMFLTTAVFRGAHHFAGVPFELDSMLQSMLVQASLSIVWTICAITLMIVGNIRIRRDIWIAGAALTAVVVAKLFLVELENRGGLERIVSFIGVGGLLLVVGYFAPLPPRKAEISAQEQDNAPSDPQNNEKVQV